MFSPKRADEFTKFSYTLIDPNQTPLSTDLIRRRWLKNNLRGSSIHPVHGFNRSDYQILRDLTILDSWLLRCCHIYPVLLLIGRLRTYQELKSISHRLWLDVFGQNIQNWINLKKYIYDNHKCAEKERFELPIPL